MCDNLDLFRGFFGWYGDCYFGFREVLEEIMKKFGIRFCEDFEIINNSSV